MSNCVHTWVGSDFGEIYCSRCKKSRYALEVKVDTEEVIAVEEVKVEPIGTTIVGTIGNVTFIEPMAISKEIEQTIVEPLVALNNTAALPSTAIGNDADTTKTTKMYTPQVNKGKAK